MLLCSKREQQGSGNWTINQEGYTAVCLDSYLSLSAYCYCCLFLGLDATFVSASIKEKTVRETEIQTIQRKVRTPNAVCHGTHFKSIRGVILLKNVPVFLFIF